VANRAPAFQFYPKDWLDFKVQRMSYEAQGVYLKILCFMWNDSNDQCSISTVVQPLSKALGLSVHKCNTILKEIQEENEPIFEEKDGRYISSRLKAERKKQDKYRSAQSKKGKKSAELRRNRGSTVVQPDTQPEGKSSSSSSSSSKEVIQAIDRLRKDHPVYRKTSDDYLNSLVADFPTIDHAKVLNKLHAFEADGGNTKQPSLRIRNWFENEKKYVGQHKGGASNDLSHLGAGVPD